MRDEFQNIIEKTSELYNRYGIKSITMDDVARELGISKKTLYRYVSNKDDLVRHFIEYETQRRQCHVNDIKGKNLNAIEELFAVNEHVIEMLQNYNASTEYDLKKYYPHLYKELRQHRRSNMLEAVKENIAKGKHEGLYRPELDDDVIARVHVSRIENSFANEMFSMQEMISWKVIREMMMYHINGIGTEKGIKFFYTKLKEFDRKFDLQ